MRKIAFFVDAGHLWAAAATIFTGTPVRSRISFDIHKMMDEIAIAGFSIPGFESSHELLRIYWYDGATDRKPSGIHNKIAAEPYVKLRLGRLSPHGGQR